MNQMPWFLQCGLWLAWFFGYFRHIATHSLKFIILNNYALRVIPYQIDTRPQVMSSKLLEIFTSYYSIKLMEKSKIWAQYDLWFESYGLWKLRVLKCRKSPQRFFSFSKFSIKKTKRPRGLIFSEVVESNLYLWRKITVGLISLPKNF